MYLYTDEDILVIGMQNLKWFKKLGYLKINICELKPTISLVKTLLIVREEWSDINHSFNDARLKNISQRQLIIASVIKYFPPEIDQ